MPRPPQSQFAGANYHIVSRGDGRRKLFHDTGHYERFTKGLEDEVQRSGWIALAYCWMPNHVHALIQTPEPNLACGMQHWLQGTRIGTPNEIDAQGISTKVATKHSSLKTPDITGRSAVTYTSIHATAASHWQAILNHGRTAVSQATLARANVSVGSPTINFTPTGTRRSVEKILHARTDLTSKKD